MILISLFKPEKDGALPVSKFFRKIFESSYVRLIFGLNLVLSSILMSGFTSNSIVSDADAVVLARPEENNIHTDLNFKIPVLGNISQGYHWYHQAIDIPSSIGAEVHAAASGKVREVDYDFLGFGYKVVVTHDNNYWTLYAHLKDIYIKVGDEISQDSVIGTVGVTGFTTGPHLHFEIHQANKSLDPTQVLSAQIATQ